jgi:uncharacterized protein YndB with AHSA1/START domain
MTEQLKVLKTIAIDASAEKVWLALTSPDLIKQYLFGTTAISDWQPGSDVKYYGEWQGKKYEDKGKVIAAEPNKLLHHTYWSSMSGTKDEPANYVHVKYMLRENDGHTLLTLEQDGVKNEENLKHLEENWGTVLEGLKRVAEKR